MRNRTGIDDLGENFSKDGTLQLDLERRVESGAHNKPFQIPAVFKDLSLSFTKTAA